MTPATPDTGLSADVISAENNAARDVHANDNPNPGADLSPVVVPPAGGQDAPSEAPARELTAREQIAENAKRARAAVNADAPLDQIARNEMGAEIPPFLVELDEAQAEVNRAAEQARAADAALADKPADKPYTLKVRGNDIPVANRDELLALAEVEPEDAASFTDAALIRLAQKQIAASSFLEEAKGAAKTARTAARAPGDTQPDNAATTVQTDPPAHDPADPLDPYSAAVEKIQFGDKEEAAAALRDLVAQEAARTADERHNVRTVETQVQGVEKQIGEAAVTFESQNADIVQDADLAPVFYNRYVVSEIRADLIAGGLPAEKVDGVLNGNIGDAMKAYIAVQTDGRVKVRTPADIMTAAEGKIRTKFNLARPANDNPNQQPAPAPAPAPVAGNRDRLAEKRGLAPQPSRSGTPQQIAATPKSGDTPEARSRVVQQMLKARGRIAA